MKVTLTTASVKVAGSSIPQSGIARNVTGTADIYVEIDGAATDTDGYLWKMTDGPLSFALNDHETLNMKVVAAGANQEVRVLRGKN